MIKDILELKDNYWSAADLCEVIDGFSDMYSRMLALNLSMINFRLDIGDNEYGIRSLDFKIKNNGTAWVETIYGTTKIIGMVSALPHYKEKHSVEYVVTEIDTEEPDSLVGWFRKCLTFDEKIHDICLNTQYTKLYLGSIFNDNILRYYISKLAIAKKLNIKNIGFDLNALLLLMQYGYDMIVEYFNVIFKVINASNMKIYFNLCEVEKEDYANCVEIFFKLLNKLDFANQYKTHLIVFQSNIFSFMPSKEYMHNNEMLHDRGKKNLSATGDKYLLMVKEIIDRYNYTCTYDF